MKLSFLSAAFSLFLFAPAWAQDSNQEEGYQTESAAPSDMQVEDSSDAVEVKSPTPEKHAKEPVKPKAAAPAKKAAPAPAKPEVKKESKPVEEKSDTATPAATATKPAATEATSAKEAKEKDKKEAPDYVVMRVNGDEIKNSDLIDAFKIMVPGGEMLAEQALNNENVRQSILREILSKKLVYKEALKEGLDKTESFEKRLELAKRQLLIQSFVEKKTAGMITDAALKKAYDERVKKLSGQEEIKARHILVTKKEDADKILKDLKAGGDFAKIAKEKSEDKGSGTTGGDLGWFTQDKMVPEFGKAAFALKKGEISAPVRSEFGYHIIQLLDRRKLPVPSFEEMSKDLEEDVINSELDKMLAGMLENADIEYFGADGRPKKFERIRKKDVK